MQRSASVSLPTAVRGERLGAHAQSLVAGMEWAARLADRIPSPHSGAERLPNFLDGSGITAVVNGAVGDLRRGIGGRAPRHCRRQISGLLRRFRHGGALELAAESS